MSFDGQNFNAMIDASLKDRMFRLLRDAEPEKMSYESLQSYSTTFEQLFTYPPTPTEAANGWHVVIVTLVGIHDRLVEAAREHRRGDIGQRGDYQEFFEMEAKLDEEENSWRAALGLPPIKSTALDE
jgi:hypothetical protein